MTPTAPAAVRRPGMLVAAIGVIVVAALTSIVNGIMIATGGVDLIKDVLVSAGLPAGLSDADIELAAQLAGYSTLDEFVDTFAMRGYLALGAGIVLLLFGLLMRNAAKWARILVTVSAALAMVFSFVILADETTSAMAGLAMLTVLASIIAIVFTWLPANGRYAKANA